MYRTLAQLRDSVNSLIEEQGENATCAAFIYTKNDVFYLNEGCEENSLDDVDTVLRNVGNTNWIYEQINDFIDDLTKDQLNPMEEDDYDIVFLD